MKNFIFILVILFSTASVKAQITLEYSNDTLAFGNFYCTDIGNNEFKYVSINEKTNSFSLYNLDMTPYLTNIIIPTTDSIAKGFSVIYITKALFDCDSTNIEYAYELQAGGRKPFRIYRTDGTLLLQVDSARGPYCFGCVGGTMDIRPIKQTPQGTKLFLDKLNLSGTGILIYSLCGSLPTDYLDFSDSKSYIKLFPNPGDTQINFEIAYPNNLEEFQLLIVDSYGKELKRENIPRAQNKYSLDVGTFSSGSYFYSLVSKNKAYQTGKFILTK